MTTLAVSATSSVQDFVDALDNLVSNKTSLASKSKIRFVLVKPPLYEEPFPWM